MNNQIFPGFLNANFKILGLDIINLVASLGLATVLKKIGVITNSNEALCLAALIFLSGEIIKIILPKNYFYFVLTRKSKIRSSRE